MEEVIITEAPKRKASYPSDSCDAARYSQMDRIQSDLAEVKQTEKPTSIGREIVVYSIADK